MVRCIGFKPNGDQCRISRGLARNRYCSHHNPDYLCISTRHNGVQCRAKRKPAYAYCCADHDPAHRPFYVAPSVFNQADLRRTKKNDIVQLYGNQDIYHGKPLPDSGWDYQLDHKFKLQGAAYAVREANIEDDEEKAIVIEFLRGKVLNEDFNLCFTRTTTNQLKGTAVKNFLDDTRTGHLNGRTFTDYMLAAAPTNRNTTVRLERKVTNAIRHKMKKANKDCQYKLEDESETPSLDAVNRQFKNLYIAMGQ